MKRSPDRLEPGQDPEGTTRRDEVLAASEEDKRALKGTRYALLKEYLVDILNRRQINVARDRLLQWIADAKGNGKIRTITRRAFGFHSASALISMIFLCCGDVQVTPASSAPNAFH